MTTEIKHHDCKTELRAVDLKATPARLAALKILEAAEKPLDVASINNELQKAGMAADPATIFRMMHSFSDKGIVRELNFQENKFRYEHTGKADHHHFICESCGMVQDISDCNISQLEKNIRKKKNLLIKRHSLEFFGLCENCQS